MESLLNRRHPRLLRIGTRFCSSIACRARSGKRLVAIKNVTVDEPFFTATSRRPRHARRAHRRGDGAGGGPAGRTPPGRPREYQLFAGIDNVRFRLPVFPGDTLRLTIEALRSALARPLARHGDGRGQDRGRSRPPLDPHGRCPTRTIRRSGGARERSSRPSPMLRCLNRSSTRRPS